MKYILYIMATLCINTLAVAAPIKIVTSASIMADMARNIAGDKAEVISLVPIGADPHVYEPTPQDVQLVANADLILLNGLSFEGWITKLIQNSGTKAPIITITEGVNVIQSSQFHNSSDPHAWMDVSNAVIYIENIKNALINIDVVNKSSYQHSYQQYKDKLLILDAYISEAIQRIPTLRRVLITSHDAFAYYGRRYGLRLESMMGISTDAEAQTADMIRLTKVIQSTQVPAIFIESTINPKLLMQVAADNHVVIGGELFADSVSDSLGKAPSYLAMLRYNTDVIVQALSREPQSSSTSSTMPPLLLWGGIVSTLLMMVAAYFLRKG